MSAGGIEPPTLCLKGRCSTTELRALKNKEHKYKEVRKLFQIKAFSIQQSGAGEYDNKKFQNFSLR